MLIASSLVASPILGESSIIIATSIMASVAFYKKIMMLSSDYFDFFALTVLFCSIIYKKLSFHFVVLKISLMQLTKVSIHQYSKTTIFRMTISSIKSRLFSGYSSMQANYTNSRQSETKIPWFIGEASAKTKTFQINKSMNS